METQKTENKTRGMKVFIWISLGMIIMGIIICLTVIATNNFNISQVFEETEYEAFTKDIDIVGNEYINIDLVSDDLHIAYSDSSKATIKYYDTASIKHVLTQTEDSISIRTDIKPNKWYQDIFSFGFDDKCVSVELPKKYCGHIKIKCITGYIGVKDISTTKLEIEHTTGDIKLQNITGNDISIVSTTGSINIDTVTAQMESLYVHNTTGDTNLRQLNAKKLFAQATTGHIKVEKIASDDISLKTGSGDIYGTIIGNESDYDISTKTTTGDCNPTSNNGGSKKLNAKATTGDIELNFITG